jgi:hypothetical protein
MRQGKWWRGTAVAAALLILGAAPATRAEPIRWSYTAQAEEHPPFRTQAVELRAARESFEVESGAETDLQVFSFLAGRYTPHDPSDPASVSDSFRARVTLTDDASGRSIGLLMQVTAWEQWEFKPAGGIWEPVAMGDDSGRQQKGSVVLGQNRYEYVAEGGTLVVSAVSASTPEPATLALAAVGLGAAGVARLRRRRV